MNSVYKLIPEGHVGVKPPQPWHQPCVDNSHDAPTHVHVPVGEVYRHVCPTCGEVQDIIGRGAH